MRELRIMNATYAIRGLVTSRIERSMSDSSVSFHVQLEHIRHATRSEYEILCADIFDKTCFPPI
jgi:hypothetical protein